ncbi:MAG: hypothetical protein K2J06_08710, partial [Muribaculaceae bacterium]|nr:hypothetical protein [Muribaculaceae bacterium]
AIPDRSTISFLAAQYIDCNGRILDGLGPAILYLLPKGVASAIMGLMTACYFALLAAAAGLWHRNRVAAADALILVALLSLPWWDYMLLRVCQLNYLWGTTFALATVMLYSRKGKKSSTWTIIGLLLCSFLAGASHEQIGVAMSAVLLPLSFHRLLHRDITRNQTAILIGLSLGTLFAISSPALWRRNSSLTADATIGELLITTLPITLLLIAVCIGCMFTSSGRTRLKALAHSSWGVYTLISVIAAIIAIYSTTPGRTGWLSESMALVALARMLFDFRYKLSTLFTSILCVTALTIIAAHYVVAIKWQNKVGQEYREVVESYTKSADGLVFKDFTLDTDIPTIALGRVKGVPDADDIYLLKVIATAYGHGHPLVILPDAFSDSLESVADSLSAGGYTIYSSRPETRTLVNPHNAKLTISSDGRVITTVRLPSGKTLFLASPFIIDPGDHWHNTLEK